MKKSWWFLLLVVTIFAVSCTTPITEEKRGESGPDTTIDVEQQIQDLENQFAAIRKSNWEVSPEGYAEIKEKIRKVESIDDERVRRLQDDFSKLIVGGTLDGETQEVNPPSEEQKFPARNRGCTDTGTVTFTFPPMDITEIETILPTGLMIGGHVTPIDHGYYTAKTWSPGQSREDLSTFREVYAPAAGVVTSVQSMPSEYRTSSIGDYRITIHHTCTFYTIYIHVNQLSEKLQSIADTGKSIAVDGGEIIGRAPGFDFSVHDDETILPGFVVPEHYDAEPWKIHTVDMFNSFTEPIRTQLLEKNVRQKEPRGGKIDQDKDKTLAGSWFEEDSNWYFGKEEYQRSIGYWKTHLAFAPDGLDPDLVIVSLGDFNDEAQQFAARGNAPDPKEVTVSTGLVKYELVSWQYLTDNGQEWDRKSFAKITDSKRYEDQVAGVVLVQMLEERKLKFESFPEKSASQVSGFTSNAKIYER